MLEDINGLWFGGEDEFTATSGGIISLDIVEVITESQTGAIITTIGAALVILTIFFWVTQGQPALGFIAVGPIVLVLIWVLGTMALLGIPYNVVTALITALSIGIGVDYTIHMIHRYKEEFALLHDPEAAASRTLATTGSALIGSALTTALGFGVLVFSPLTPFQQFGVVTAITIAYALVAAVLVVPPGHDRLGRVPEPTAAARGGTSPDRARRSSRRRVHWSHIASLLCRGENGAPWAGLWTG